MKRTLYPQEDATFDVPGMNHTMNHCYQTMGTQDISHAIRT